jgi:hypothetical protein
MLSPRSSAATTIQPIIAFRTIRLLLPAGRGTPAPKAIDVPKSKS